MCANGCSDFTVKCKIGWVSRSSKGEPTYDDNNAIAWVRDLRPGGQTYPVCRDHVMSLRQEAWKYWKLLPIPGKEMPEEVELLRQGIDAMHERQGIRT